MDLVVAGTEVAVLMVESEAKELSEEVMLGAVVFGHKQKQAVINLIHELVDACGKPIWDWQPQPRTRPDRQDQGVRGAVWRLHSRCVKSRNASKSSRRSAPSVEASSFCRSRDDVREPREANPVRLEAKTVREPDPDR